ncbi:hypothetical protein [Candidatus Sodalis pierantonius]|uniref:hypothetical protein n=1 Tax=Candidatus Sodalis pierantonii TaxID=1486991 RepID=UPI0011DDAAD0|nr:hypothetical protein [Candidatus Sodalis pierantonius]
MAEQKMSDRTESESLIGRPESVIGCDRNQQLLPAWVKLASSTTRTKLCSSASLFIIASLIVSFY